LAISNQIIDREYKKFVETPAGDTAVRVLNEFEWKEVRFDPDSDEPEYIGLNKNLNASIDAESWLIIKLSTDKTLIQRVTGAWSNRTSLF
jgi:hypothetical protein